MGYQSTTLWERAFGPDATSDREKRDRLVGAYRSFWSNAVILSNQIQRDVPNLTLHDEAHFEALWERADQIAGALVLSPLEVFVLGGAILLHDNANSIAAFAGGLAELENTPEWKDAAAEWMNKRSSDSAGEQGAESPEAKAAILFDVLRGQHAERAETLADLKFHVEGDEVRLFEDDQLRRHLGRVIGLVAASHHWSSSDLSDRLPHLIGALGGMPQSWTIRPLLLACLLRVADAVQLDQQRAPDFLYGLLQLKGVSELHWRAQNRLAAPTPSLSDPAAFVLASTRPFESDDAEAWWIAHDAVVIANAELQAADIILRDFNLPRFAINRIEGARSPKALARYVETIGWHPVQAEVKITQVDKIVEMFGGRQLYGSQTNVALREMIQNAADAVRFRRELEPSTTDYQGRITIRLTAVGDGSPDSWLDVEDDGLGMSEAVLTGPLIDFGSSYLSSALVKSERPGLLSKGRSRIGRFGIGFFSCFMLADDVLVTSRPFDAGRAEFRTLQFSGGLGHRPLLVDAQTHTIGSTLSTRIRLRLTPEKRENLLTFKEGVNAKPLTLFEVVGLLCPMVDVDIHVEQDGDARLVHHRRWMDEDRPAWLSRVLISDARKDALSPDVLGDSIRDFASLARFINPDVPSQGLATVAGAGGTGVRTVGGLRAGELFNPFASEFMGTIDFEPSDPTRSRGEFSAGKDKVAAWATAQAQLVSASDAPATIRRYAAKRVAGFGGDSSPIATIKFNRVEVSIPEMFEHLKSGEPVYAPVSPRIGHDAQAHISVVREHQTGFIDNYRPEELEYLVRTIEGDSDSALYAIPTSDEPTGPDFISMLARVAIREGYGLQMEGLERVDFARYVGQDSPREGLPYGKLIGCTALKLALIRLRCLEEVS